MSNHEKRQAAVAWMRERGISLDKRKWVGPAIPLPNLAGRQPVITVSDYGLLGQWRSLLRSFL